MVTLENLGNLTKDKLEGLPSQVHPCLPFKIIHFNGCRYIKRTDAFDYYGPVLKSAMIVS